METRRYDEQNRKKVPDMNKTNGLIAILILNICNIGRSQDALVWDARELEVEPSVTAKMVDQQFWFTNGSDHAVKILEAKTSCGCTTAAMVQTDFKPHERGFVPVEYKFGEATGLQEKEITVTTDEQPQKHYLLKLKANIPTIATASPGSLIWTFGEADVAKTAEISLNPAMKADVLEAMSTNDTFDVVFKIVKPGALYAVDVKPRRLDVETRGAIELTVKLENGFERIETIPVEISVPETLTKDAARDPEN